MTISQRLKLAIIDALKPVMPDTSITVVDAKQRELIELPTFAVDVASVSAFNETLQMVQRIGMEMTLRIHSGEDEEAMLNTWIDQIESALCDESALKFSLGTSLLIHQWVYMGSDQEWDGEIIEARFYSEVLASRN